MNKKPKFIFEQKKYNYEKLKNKFLKINLLLHAISVNFI